MLHDALCSGVSVAEFWDQTPRETFAAIDAANWLARRRHKESISLAWQTANWFRAKRLPSLWSALNSSKPARPLRGEEKIQRRREFKRLASQRNVAMINEHMKQLKAGNK